MQEFNLANSLSLYDNARPLQRLKFPMFVLGYLFWSNCAQIVYQYPLCTCKFNFLFQVLLLCVWSSVMLAHIIIITSTNIWLEYETAGSQ